MYQNIHYQREKNLIHLWDDEKGYRTIPYRKYAYIKSANGGSVALDGTVVKKVNKWDENDVARGHMYESDVNPEMRILIDLYGETDESSTGHKILFLDIEVMKQDGYSTIEEAKNTINAITIYDNILKKYITYVLDETFVLSNRKGPREIVVCETERELLTKFLEGWNEVQPHIVTGWNSDFFDIPYLYNRMCRVVGKQAADTLSPLGEVRLTNTKEDARQRYKIAGVSCLDYMSLYKQFTQNEQSSYALNAIANKELNRTKIQYEGDLDVLYKTDINKFVEYNVVDVELIVEMDEKLKFLDLAIGICHKGHVPYESIYFSSKYLEGAALTYLKRIEVVAPNKVRAHMTSDEYGDKDDQIEGAYVKPPTPGLYKWLFDLDLQALYPSIIMTLNISPETKVGKLANWNEEEHLQGVDKVYTGIIEGKETTYSRDDFSKLLATNKYSISSNGVLYRTDTNGFLPTILDLWFNERVEYKNQMKQAHKAGDMDRYHYYNRLQSVQKILLNSFYGVLALQTFRFHDTENAEAITLTGQSVIRFTEKMANHYINNITKADKDYVIAIDTDSIFVHALPLIKQRHPGIDETNVELMTDKIKEMTTEVQDFVNKGYDMYSKKFHGVDKHRFFIKQEVIAKSGLWVAKKRYAQWMVSKEGLVVDEMDVKGLDVVRSNFPKAFGIYMKQILSDILNDVPQETINDKILDFKDEFRKLPIREVMLSTGVKEVSKWTTDDPVDRLKGTPAHVKAALNFNFLLGYYKIKHTKPISDGDKVKWAYLKQNEFGLPSVAITGFADPKAITDLLDKYIDYDKIYESALVKKLQDFYDALGYGTIPNNKNLAKFFEF